MEVIAFQASSMGIYLRLSEGRIMDQYMNASAREGAHMSTLLMKDMAIVMDVVNILKF